MRLRELEIGFGQLADPEFDIAMDTEARREFDIQFKRPLLALAMESLSKEIEKGFSMPDFMQKQDKPEQSLTFQATMESLSKEIEKGFSMPDFMQKQDKPEQSLTFQASGSDELDNADYPDSNADEGNNQSDNKGNFANTLNKKRKLREKS